MAAEDVEKVLESLGGLAVDARRAMKAGGDWEWRPDTVEWLDAWPVHDDEDDRWRLMWYGSAYSVVNGELYHDVDSCDSDGNWELVEGYPVAAPDYPADHNKYWGEAALDAAWQAYFDWVINRGRDPLGELVLPPRPPGRARWEVNLGNWVGGAEHGFVVRGARAAGAQSWAPPNADVAAYLGAERRPGLTRLLVCPAVRSTAPEGLNAEVVESTPNGVVLAFELPAPAPPPAYDEVVHAARVAASRRLCRPWGGERDVLAGVLSNSADPTGWLVLADWYDERADPRGKRLRELWQTRP